MHFLNAFWHGNEAFPKGSSQNDVVRLLIIFHLPYSKFRGVKMFLHVSLSESKFFTRVALVSFAQRSCRSCFTRVALLSHLSRTRVARVWHSCCKLDQISIKWLYFGTLVLTLHSYCGDNNMAVEKNLKVKTYLQKKLCLPVTAWNKNIHRSKLHLQYTHWRKSFLLLLLLKVCESFQFGQSKESCG